MAMSKRERERQPPMWVTELLMAASHPFYDE
jgi:hypothetical protein